MEDVDFHKSSVALALLVAGLFTGTTDSIARMPANIVAASAVKLQGSAAAAPIALVPGYTFLDFPGTTLTSVYQLSLGALVGARQYVIGGYGPSITINNFDFNSSGFKVTMQAAGGGATEAYEPVEPSMNPLEANGVNDHGAIVGQFGSTLQHGFVLKGGVFKQVDVPYAGATLTTLNGINDSGTIAGAWIAADGVTEHSFTLKDGVFTPVPDYPGATQTWVESINSNGDMTGYFVDSSGNYHGMLLQGGSYVQLDYPGSGFTLAEGLNDSDTVVGFYCATSSCSTGVFGYVYSGGTYTTVRIAGEPQNLLNAIDNHGVIAGYYVDTQGITHSYLITP